MNLEDIKDHMTETVKDNMEELVEELYKPEKSFSSSYNIYGTLQETDIKIQTNRIWGGPDPEEYDYQLQIEQINQEVEDPQATIIAKVEDLLEDVQEFKIVGEDIKDPRKIDPSHRPTLVAIETLRYCSQYSGHYGVSKSDLKDYLELKMNNTPSDATLTRVLKQLEGMGYLRNRGKKWRREDLLDQVSLEDQD